MLEIMDNIKLMLTEIIKVKPRENLLIISDSYARSRAIADAFREVANSMGAQTVLSIMEPSTHIGQEPPPPISEAMAVSNVIISVFEKVSAGGHTTARKKAIQAGARYFALNAAPPEDYLRSPISLADLNRIKELSERLAELMTRGKVAQVTTPYGTDLTATLQGRRALPLHPLGETGIAAIPDYAEVAISPVEGTSQGIVMVDVSIRGWGYIFQAPLRFQVKNGKIQAETVSSEIAEDAERFKRVVLFDSNASNCAAEIGIGTSHIAPKVLRGDFLSNYGIAGNVHIGIGRNDDIGGETWSQIHNDLLMTRADVKIDDTYVVRNGQLVV